MNVSPASGVAQGAAVPITGAGPSTPPFVPSISDIDTTGTSGVPLGIQPLIQTKRGGVLDAGYVGNVTASINFSAAGDATLTGETVVAFAAGDAAYTNFIITTSGVDSVVIAFTLDNGQFALSDPIAMS